MCRMYIREMCLKGVFTYFQVILEAQNSSNMLSEKFAIFDYDIKYYRKMLIALFFRYQVCYSGDGNAFFELIVVFLGQKGLIIPYFYVQYFFVKYLKYYKIEGKKIQSSKHFILSIFSRFDFQCRLDFSKNCPSPLYATVFQKTGDFPISLLYICTLRNKLQASVKGFIKNQTNFSHIYFN